MNLRPFALGLTVAALTFGCQSMNKEHEDEEGDEVQMTLDQVPPAVREGLQREAGGAAITKVDKENEHGRTGYEVDVKIDGKNWEIVVDENGKLISRKLDDENEAGEKKEKDD
jgi:uncharacterized membrane protein YkoI